MYILDLLRGVKIEFSETLGASREIEIISTSDSGDCIIFYLNEEQAREVVRYLNRVFDLGLKE